MKIVKVTWYDATSSWNHNYFKLRNAKDFDLVLRKSVGYLLEENSEKTIIAQDFRDDGCYGKIIAIPTKTIKKIEELKKL